MNSDPIVIVGAKRTPIGHMLGCLTPLSAVQLGSHAIRGALTHAQLKPNQIDEVIMGCVLPAGLGQAPARQAAIHAKIPHTVATTTINKMCGSGMKAVMFAHDLLKVGERNIMLAGGMESMSNAPFLLPNARQGYRLGHKQILDHMMYDGLEDAYDRGQAMGVFAEQTATKYHITREQQDEFALSSVTRAQQATENGIFSQEIIPIDVKQRKISQTISQDEGPLIAKPEKIAQLKPAFAAEGSVTAANSSSISDGAAALVLMRQSTADQLGLSPLARILAHATHSHQPQWFTTAPISAIQNVLVKADWALSDVDVFEINEAFAVVTLVAMQELGIPHEKTNIFGGACVLGHPIGATGARIIVTLLNALQQRQKKRGIASLCIGGGEATAIAIERSN